MRVHRLGVQKRVQNWKTGVFLIILTNFGKDMTDKLRKTCIKGLFLYMKNTCLGCILKVLLRG